MRVSLPAAALLGLLALACASTPPSESTVVAARSPDEIAERLLDARRRGDAEDAWCCFAGETGRKRVYHDHRRPGDRLTWEEFVRDLDMGWATPALAPADVWEKVGERQEGACRVLVYRQGTDDEPDRGLIEIAACPAGTGWLVAWVGTPR